jgi:hypothetical protein
MGKQDQDHGVRWFDLRLRARRLKPLDYEMFLDYARKWAGSGMSEDRNKALEEAEAFVNSKAPVES